MHILFCAYFTHVFYAYVWIIYAYFMLDLKNFPIGICPSIKSSPYQSGSGSNEQWNICDLLKFDHQIITFFFLNTCCAFIVLISSIQWQQSMIANRMCNAIREEKRNRFSFFLNMPHMFVEGSFAKFCFCDRLCAKK